MANLNQITDPLFILSASFGIAGSDITNWNTAFGWGNHALAGYATASNVMAFTNKTGNISMWTNDAGYLTSAPTPTLNQVLTAGNTSTLSMNLTGSVASDFVGAFINTNGTSGHGLYTKVDNGIPFRVDIGANIYGQLNGSGRWLLGQNTVDDGSSAVIVNGRIRSNDQILSSDGTVNTILSYSGAGGVIGTNSNHPAIFWANSAERMRITPAGLVGIGTSSPFRDFVVSNAGAQGIELSSTAGGGNPSIMSYNRSTNLYANLGIEGEIIQFSTGTSSVTERMRITATGNVGIGITPTEALHLGIGRFHISSAGAPPSAGNGLFMYRSGSAGFINSRDFTGGIYNDMFLLGDDIEIGGASGVGNLNITKAVTSVGGALGVAGNATFAANGTPAIGKVPTGTDALGNWTWETLAAPPQSFGSWTPTGAHVVASGTCDYVKTGALTVYALDIDIAVNSDATPMFIGGFIGSNTSYGSAVLMSQTNTTIVTPIIGEVQQSTGLLYFTGLTGLGSVYNWQDFSGAHLRVMVTYIQP